VTRARRAVPVALLLLAVLGGCATDVVEAGPEVEAPEGMVLVTASPEPAPDAETDTGTDTDAGSDGAAERFAIGDCLVWDQGAATAVFERIDCAEPHLAEVAGLLDLSAVYPADAALPTTEELVAEGASACPDVVAAYLGGEPASDVEGGVLVPSAGDWELGNRTWFCTVGFARQDGRRPAYTGRLAQDDAVLA
jgi:hypothetical protein